MKRTVIGVALSFLFVSSALAGSSSGQVTKIYVVESDVVLFAAGPHTGKPACSTVGDEWALSLTTAAGRSMYALLLFAKAQGKSVTVYGNGTCSAWGDRETPNWISTE